VIFMVAPFKTLVNHKCAVFIRKNLYFAHFLSSSITPIPLHFGHFRRRRLPLA
jgi:hypothetical protein